MEVIIKKSKKNLIKSLMRLSTVRSRYHLVQKVIQIIQFIRIQNVRKDILIGIRIKRNGGYQVLKQLDFMLNIYYGINQQLKNQLRI